LLLSLVRGLKRRNTVAALFWNGQKCKYSFMWVAQCYWSSWMSCDLVIQRRMLFGMKLPNIVYFV